MRNGEFLVMASRKYIDKAKSKSTFVYDALEKMVFGKVKNKLKLRTVVEGDTWAFVFKRGKMEDILTLVKYC